MSIMRTLLSIIIILCVLLNWGCTEGARKISSGKGCSQTIKVSSLFHSSSSLSSSCSLSSEGLQGSCSDSTCGYSVGYGDTSTSQGFIAKEKFTLTSSDVFDDINFGCGENNTGDYYEGVAGLLGLGPGKLSFPS
ncbi:Xylanase inhibitor N-terminal, partial [Arabidopsis thaliana x Arabidopsis arenosa]